jgi:hypothetical protein
MTGGLKNRHPPLVILSERTPAGRERVVGSPQPSQPPHLARETRATHQYVAAGFTPAVRRP